MKKICFMIVSLLVSLFLLNINVGSEEKLTVSAQSAVLLEGYSGRILYEKNSNEQRPIASISKIMTALVAIENARLDDYVTISKQATLQVGSSLYLKQGDKITLNDLLYGLMLRSGNDAAYAIAESVAGNVDMFVQLMNEKAKDLGLKNTTFENPSGLDEDNRNISTAYDMALIAKNAMENPLFREINNTSNYKATTLDGKIYSWTNKHKLIKGYDFVIGGKTGYTKLAKRTLVSVAQKENMELIAVTLNDSNDWEDHLKLFDYGFQSYDLKTLMPKGIFEVKQLNQIFYLEDKIVYPLTIDETNDFKFVIDVNEENGKSYLLLIKDNRIMLKREIKKYDVSNSSLSDSFTIMDVWDGIITFMRELLW